MEGKFLNVYYFNVTCILNLYDHQCNFWADNGDMEIAAIEMKIYVSKL